ncbi:hypothetical protein [Phenylobacterium sp.]|uniref:hypothetical protein n=1 Tax=Phenylobacterium sp. TaxID=1871053 RepID=UPI0028111DAA|nr:hypothetical protein [Phenylobacterium sp.]
MTKTASARPGETPDKRFRSQIEAAVADGVAREDMTLKLTLRDASRLTRDPNTPVSDVSFAGGTMRFLGVKIEQGGVAESVLERGQG